MSTIINAVSWILGRYVGCSATASIGVFGQTHLLVFNDPVTPLTLEAAAKSSRVGHKHVN